MHFIEIDVPKKKTCIMECMDSSKWW